MKKYFYISLLLIPITLTAQWQWQNPKPFGDPILDVFFVNENVGWMAPDNTTLLKTTNGGNKWEIIYTDILFEDLFFINILEGWGIGRTNQFYETNSIYHTIDGGDTWEIQLSDTSVRYEIFFINEKIGWATGDFSGSIDNYSHLFKTTDGGKTWKLDAINQLDLGGAPKGVHFLDSLKGWLVGAISYGVYTTDGGITWVRDSSLAGIKKIISVDSLHLWGLSDYDFIVRTTDGGISWDSFKIIDTTIEVRANDIYAVDKNNVYVSTNIGFFGSTDGGTSFSFLAKDTMKSFFFISPQEVWGGGKVVYSGIYHSTNGGKNWINLVETNNEFGFDRYLTVDFINENVGWILGEKSLIGTGSFILKTTTDGENWFSQYFNPNVSLRDLIFFDENTGWAVGSNGLVIKTINGGTDWTIKNSGTNYTLLKVAFTDSKHGWAVGGVIIKTTDGGQNWIDVTPSFQISSPNAISFVDSLTGWVSTDGYRGKGFLLKTTDGGINWVIQSEAYGLTFNVLYAKNNQEVWAGGYDSELNSNLIYTLDGGLNWDSKPIIAEGIYDIKFTDINNGWLISLKELFHTIDGGNNWEKQNLYSTRWLHSIDLINNENGWIVGSWGTILHTTNGGVTFIEDFKHLSEISDNIKIYQNYPNPFNPSTAISYQLSTFSKVTLRVYDVLGREVAVLVNKEQTAGKYSVHFNASGLSSGIYFYRLSVISSNNTSLNNIQVKKMVLIK